MDGGNASPDADLAEEIDVERYKTDRDYRRRIHEDLEIAGDDDLLDLEEHPDEEPAFDSSRYATEEEADAALSRFMDEILEEALREVAENDSHGTRT